MRIKFEHIGFKKIDSKFYKIKNRSHNCILIANPIIANIISCQSKILEYFMGIMVLVGNMK